jgi:hypothetical protein
LQKGTGIKGMIDFLSELTKGNSPGYNPTFNYWNNSGISGGIAGDIYGYSGGSQHEYTAPERNWMSSYFYPRHQIGGKLNVTVLVMTCYIKVFRMKTFTVKKIVNGKVVGNATAKEHQMWKKNTFTCGFDLVFSRVKPGSKPSPGEYVVSHIRPQIWEFTSVGHDTFMGIRPYRYQPTESQTADPLRVPVVARIGYQKSMCSHGKTDALQVAVISQRTEEIVANIGISTAMGWDKTQPGDPITTRQEIKKTGIAQFEPRTFNGQDNNNSIGHLKPIQLDNQINELQALNAIKRQIIATWELRMGLGPQVQGQSDKYDGLRETQMNIENQQVLTAEFFWEHTQFMNDVLQRTADVCRFAFPYNGYVTHRLSRQSRAVLIKSNDFELAQYGIRLESGQLLFNRLTMLRKMVETAVASGGAESVADYYTVLATNNTAEVMSVWNQIKERAVARQKQLDDQQQQQAAAAAAARKEEIDGKLAIEKAITVRDITVAQIKMGLPVEQSIAATSQEPASPEAQPDEISQTEPATA